MRKANDIDVVLGHLLLEVTSKLVRDSAKKKPYLIDGTYFGSKVLIIHMILG